MLPGIICNHVGGQGKPALFVEHAVDEEDLTGWAIYCSYTEHATSDLRIADLDRFMTQDSSLQDLRTSLQEGQYARRQAPGQPWIVETIPSNEEAA